MSAYKTISSKELEMKNGIIVVAIAIFLTACATTANYEKILSSWVGKNADDLVSSWGPSSQQYGTDPA